MKCINCGERIMAGASYCAKCGTKVQHQRKNRIRLMPVMLVIITVIAIISVIIVTGNNSSLLQTNKKTAQSAKTTAASDQKHSSEKTSKKKSSSVKETEHKNASCKTDSNPNTGINSFGGYEWGTDFEYIKQRLADENLVEGKDYKLYANGVELYNSDCCGYICSLFLQVEDGKFIGGSYDLKAAITRTVDVSFDNNLIGYINQANNARSDEETMFTSISSKITAKYGKPVYTSKMDNMLSYIADNTNGDWAIWLDEEKDMICLNSYYSLFYFQSDCNDYNRLCKEIMKWTGFDVKNYRDISDNTTGI